MNYDKIEEEIISEKPYDWKKHFLFNMPEMFFFFLKVIVIYGIVHVFVFSMATALIEKLPEFCKLIK